MKANAELLNTGGSAVLKSLRLSHCINEFIPTGKDTCIASRLAWWNEQIGYLKLTQIDRRVISECLSKINASNGTVNRYKADFGTLCKWISKPTI